MPDPGGRMTDARVACRAALLTAVVALVLAGCSAQAADGPTATPGVPLDAPVETATATPSAPPPDLSTFVAVDRAAWAAIDNAPAAAEGQQVVVFAVVSQVFTTGGGRVAVHIATAHPATASEGTPALLRPDPPEVLAGVAVGDVLRVHAEVLGVYSGTAGGSVLLPELRVIAAEEVGPYNVAGDVVLGAVERGATTAVVPVTVTNSADTTMEYRVEVVAVAADGATQLDSAGPRFGYLEPGQSATLDVRFPGVPGDANIAVAGVTRALPGTT